jgi:hypothetical protein
MTMSTATAMSNAVARRYFLHDLDTHHEDTYSVDNPRCCYFCESTGESGWGFWVRPCGTVDVDETSANGKLPDRKTVAACVRAAVRHLKKRYPQH